MSISENDRSLSPREVGILFGVTAKTVARWADSGYLVSFRTPGGHRRFTRESVDHLLSNRRGGQIHGSG